MKALTKIANCGPAHMPRTDGEGKHLKDRTIKPMVRGPVGSERTMLKDKLKITEAPGGSQRTMLKDELKRSNAPGGSNRKSPAGTHDAQPFGKMNRKMDPKKLTRGALGAGSKGVNMKEQKWEMSKQTSENMFTKKAELEENMLSFDEDMGTVLRTVKGEI